MEIPTITTPQAPQNPQMSPEIAGSGWGAQAQAGSAMSQTTLLEAKVANAVQLSKDWVKVQAAENQIKAQINQEKEGYEKRGDFENFPQDWEAKRTAIYDQYQKTLEPHQWRALAPHLNNSLIEMDHYVNEKEIKGYQDKGKGELKTALLKAVT